VASLAVLKAHDLGLLDGASLRLTVRKVNTTALVTWAGSFATTLKKTFRSNAVASSVLGLARTPSKPR
jgi:hypothetical protein